MRVSCRIDGGCNARTTRAVLLVSVWSVLRVLLVESFVQDRLV